MGGEPKLRAEWFWTDRWFSSSACCLPIDSRGLYRELLTRSWSLGARLPNNPEMLMRLAGVTREEWERCWPLVKPYWREQDGYLVNDTQLEVYADAKLRQQVRTNRAKKAAQARWQAPPEQCSSNAQASAKQCPPSPSLSKSKTQEPEKDVSDASHPHPGKPGINGAVGTVWAAFAERHPKATLTPARQKLIASHLRAGYPPESLIQAIEGLHLSKWHTETGNLTLEYGLRNADKIEKCMAIVDDPRHPDRISSGTARPKTSLALGQQREWRKPFEAEGKRWILKEERGHRGLWREDRAAHMGWVFVEEVR